MSGAHASQDMPQNASGDPRTLRWPRRAEDTPLRWPDLMVCPLGSGRQCIRRTASVSHYGRQERSESSRTRVHSHLRMSDGAGKACLHSHGSWPRRASTSTRRWRPRAPLMFPETVRGSAEGAQERHGAARGRQHRSSRINSLSISQIQMRAYICKLASFLYAFWRQSMQDDRCMSLHTTRSCLEDHKSSQFTSRAFRCLTPAGPASLRASPRTRSTHVCRHGRHSQEQRSQICAEPEIPTCHSCGVAPWSHEE